MTSLWSQATETVSSTGVGNAGTIGLHITVSEAGTLPELWLYSPAGHSLVDLPSEIGLFNFSTQALIHSEAASWSGAAGSGWVYAAFTSPPSLAAGTGYMAAAFLDSTAAWFAYDEPFTWPVSNAPITAPKDTGNGQGWYNNTTTGAIAFPGQQLPGYNWYLDVSFVATGTAHTATAADTVTPSSSAHASAGDTPHTATAAVSVAPSAAAASGSRNKFAWPFTWPSIWNMPISADATYAASGITVTSDYSTNATAVSFNCSDPTQPVKTLTNAMLANSSIGPASVYVPPAMSAPGEWNDGAAFLGTDNDTVYQGATLLLTAGGNPSFGGTADAPDAVSSITGTGYYGGGGSGLSVLGGTLTAEDLTGSGPIQHVMKLVFNGYEYYSSAGAGYVWPAVTADDGYNDPSNGNYYGGSNPAVCMGTLLALPPTINPLTEYTDPLVQKIATAMQCYGALIVDNTASGPGVSDSFILLNYDAVSYFTGGGTFSSDFHALLEAIQVVTNNASSTPGGGAIGSDRYAPYAPASSDGTLAAPPAVTVVTPGATPLMQTLQDAFPGSTLNATNWGSYGTVAVSGGQAEIDATTGESGIYTQSEYTLTGSSMLAKVTPYTGGTSPYAYLQAAVSSGDGGVGIGYSGGDIYAYWISSAGAQTNLSSITYNATTHAWWRIRESGGTTFFDTAPDGATWTNRWSVADPAGVSFTSLLAQFGAGIGSGTAGNALLADFNLPPSGAAASLSTAPATAATAVHGHAAAAALTVTPVPSATGSSAGSSSGSITAQDGGGIAAQDGNPLQVQGTPGPVAHTATAGLTVAPAGAASTSGGSGHPHTASAAVTVTPSTAAAAAGGAGPAFPQAVLDLDCDLLLGTTWTDVSTYVYQRDGDTPPVNLTRGRPDENGQANPGTGSWEWNNRDGRFSPKNPNSPFYGQFGRNTPVRWSVPAQVNYLRLEADDNDRAYVNDDSLVDITGSVEMRIALRLTDWQACVLAAKWDGGTAGCWIWQLNGDGTMSFGWSDAGGTFRSASSDAPVPVTSTTIALRVTLDATVGTLAFWTSDAIDGTYAQLGDAWAMTGGAATSITVQPSPLVVGWSANYPGQLCGSVFEYRLYNGIRGTVVADGAFTAQPEGTVSWTDGAGNLWQLAGGAELSSRNYRGHLEMSAIPGKWDNTGRDVSVPATAGGLLRRLGQGDAPDLSPITRAISLAAGSLAPVAYWPCEDLQGATLIGSATGGPNMTFQGGTGDGSTTTTGPALAADTSFLCSNALPTLNGSSWTGAVPYYSGATAAVTRFLCKLGTLPAASGDWSDLFRVALTGKCRSLEVQAYFGGYLGLVGYDSAGAQQFNSGAVVFGGSADNKNLWFSVEATPVSGGVQYSLATLVPGASSGSEWSTTVATTAGFGLVTSVQVNPDAFFTDTVLGEVSVQKAWSSLFDYGQPLNAWQGETAAARFARLAGENGLACRIIGSPDRSQVMGAQPVDTLTDMLQECEVADRGQIFEPRQCLALGYRTLASMLNQAAGVTADYTASVLGGIDGGGDSGLDPTYDDQFSINDMTLTRGSGNVSGANFQYQLADGSPMSISEPPVGIGDYANSDTVNVLQDEQLPDLAGWEVHVGTVDEARWPGIPFNLARPEVAGSDLYWAVIDADIGDYVQLDNLPELQTSDPARQLVWQVTEALGGKHYTLSWNAVPESPYECAVFDDPVYGLAASDGSELAAAAAYPQSSLSVAATGPSGILWATTAQGAAVPFDIDVAGMRLTVTGISGTASPQTFEVTPAVNGVEKNLPAGAALSLWFAPYLSLV